jgi:hypothetical protein
MDGRALRARRCSAASNRVVSGCARRLGPAVPIIGVGGVTSPGDAIAKRQAGADIVQIYTGFIYKGPELVTARRARLRPCRPRSRADEAGSDRSPLRRREACWPGAGRCRPWRFAARSDDHAGHGAGRPESVQFKTASGRILSPEQAKGCWAPRRAPTQKPDSLARHLALEQEDFRHAAQPGEIASRPCSRTGRTPTPPWLSAHRSGGATTSTWRPTILEDDEAGRQLRRRADRQASRGRAVHLIRDGVGTLGTPKEFFKRLKDAGIEVLEFQTRSTRSPPRRAGT